MLIALVKHMNLNKEQKKKKEKHQIKRGISFSILTLCAICWLERHNFLHNIIAYQHISLGQVTENGD